jgi:osmotically-inducible protein OsmY
MNDKQLRQNVIDELDYEPSIDSADIGVTAESGVVTLTGHVTTYPQKLAAEKAAWRVKGVKGVAQEIKVRFAGDKKVADDEIAQRALSILAWNASVPHDALRVKVENGWVTLSGVVNWNYQRLAAESDMHKLSGVIGVINLVTLAPETQKADVKQRITEALKRNAEVEADAIQVSVRDGGVISLEGKVESWDERRAAEHAAWSAPGVRMVEDHLRIG